MNWVHREPPLLARGLVVARSSAAQDLVERLSREPERIGALTGLCGDDLLVVLGASDALPWIDGATWVGPDPDAPSLWTPCTRAPQAPSDLVAQAVARQLGTEGPWLAIPGDTELVLLDLTHAGPIHPGPLHAWWSA